MQYYTALQLADANGQPTGLWHYTCNGRPTGYCSRFRDCPDCNGQSFMTAIECLRCQNKGYIEVDPCPGHATVEEAEAHFIEYQIDTATFNRTMSRQQRPCAVCGAWTQRFAQLGGFGHIYELCDDHHTPEYLKQAVEARERRLEGKR